MKHKIISTTTKKKYIGNRTIATAYRIPAVSAKARRFSSIPRTYFYQLFQGTRRPGRDKVLVLTIAMECTLEECNRLLTLAHQSILYARNPRDALFLHALHAHRTLFQLEESLQAYGLPLLQRYE